MQKRKGEKVGIEGFIENMDTKLKKLFENIIVVIMIMMIVYGAVTFIFAYMQYNSFMAWFSTPGFVTTVVILVFVGIAYKMLKGGKLSFPEPDKDKKTTFNIPDVYGVKKTRDGGQGTKLNMPNPFGVDGQQKQKMSIPNPMGQKTKQQFNPPEHWKQTNQPLKGSWKCPSCNSVVVGNTCLSCGYRRQ